MQQHKVNTENIVWVPTRLRQGELKKVLLSITDSQGKEAGKLTLQQLELGCKQS